MNVIRELEQLDETNDYYVYGTDDFALPFHSPRWRRRILIHEPSRFRGRFGHLRLKNLITPDSLDVFWGTIHLFPAGIPRSVAKVLTVYDLVWHRYPRTMALRNYLQHRVFADSSIRQADRIITISRFVADDLQRTLSLARQKISVVYPAAEAHYRPLDRHNAANFVAHKYGTCNKYICTVGAFEPRKDFVTLLEAVAILRKNNFPYQLIAAGTPGWRNATIYQAARRLGLTEKEVKFLGYVSDEDMPALYSGAHAFVFPSLYEGFGIPLVEAMACGVPVVASNTASIPEVVGDAAILVSPRRSAEFAEAVGKVVYDASMSSPLVDKGLRRAEAFVWTTAARRVLDVLVASVSGTRPRVGAMARPRAAEEG